MKNTSFYLFKIKTKIKKMLVTKKTLIKMVLFLRRKLGLNEDKYWRIFVSQSEVEDIMEIYQGLFELWLLRKKVGRLEFAYSLV
ncbi:MAG: hypothetical protein U5L76_05545 [Patescibacteria group bacterium]|nr:hypothetical protein [Patescibacteria group bacterium]